MKRTRILTIVVIMLVACGLVMAALIGYERKTNVLKGTLVDARLASHPDIVATWELTFNDGRITAVDNSPDEVFQTGAVYRVVRYNNILRTDNIAERIDSSLR